MCFCFGLPCSVVVAALARRVRALKAIAVGMLRMGSNMEDRSSADPTTERQKWIAFAGIRRRRASLYYGPKATLN